MLENAKYFLSVNSAEGFFSEFSNCYEPKKGWRAYIIKGGPGNGKSSFMRKVLSRAKEMGMAVDEILCTGDPDSLDAVVIYDIKTVVMDGTAPHVTDPLLPGVSDRILNFGDFWCDERLVQHSDEIGSLFAKNKHLHFMAAQYIKAAGGIMKAAISLVADSKRQSADEKAALTAAENYFKQKERIPRETTRYLSGVTPKGITDLSISMAATVEHCLIINDPIGIAASGVIGSLRQVALKNGHDTVVFKNPILPLQLIDGAFFPSVSLLVLRVDKTRKYVVRGEEIDLSGQYSAESIAESAMLTADMNMLLMRASQYLKKAKEVHDEIEKHYISAMDFDMLNQYCDSVLSKIFK